MIASSKQRLRDIDQSIIYFFYCENTNKTSLSLLDISSNTAEIGWLNNHPTRFQLNIIFCFEMPTISLDRTSYRQDFFSLFSFVVNTVVKIQYSKRCGFNKCVNFFLELRIGDERIKFFLRGCILSRFFNIS